MYNSLSTFLLRTPYFSVSALADFEKRLNEPVFREMLQIASPDLSVGIDKGKDNVQYSAYRYYQRACTRSTPFGLFAGCSVGTFGGEYTNILLSPHKAYRRTTRLNMNFISALTQLLEREKKIRAQLHYFPNSSMYPVGNYYRYMEYYYQKTRRVHQIENSEYIQKILTLAKGGKLISELAVILVDDDIAMEEASEFILELIDEQVLVSELELAVTNTQPLNRLIDIIKGLPNTDSPIINILSTIDTQLDNIDQQSIGNTVDIFFETIKNIDKTKQKVEIKYLFQTDLFKPVQQATVSLNILKSIQQVLIFLNKITPSNTQTNLDRFKENFVKRYEYQEMPLLFVLDNELGIGYGDNISSDINPLINDLLIPYNTSQSNVLQSPIHSILLQKCQQSFQKVVELTDEDVKDIEVKWDDLPPTMSVVCEILQDNEQGHLCHIKSISGPSAASWLGRFCHLDDQIMNHTLAIIEKEAQMHPDVIFAEIVHLPESQARNALLRPVLRSYEIPYLAKAGVSEEFELKPDDLYISVKGDRIILRSKRLNKEIIPRMSNAHNYSGQKSMSVYHFLCDMQHQNGRDGLWFNWDIAVRKLDYLPRVIYKNCILARARWIIHGKEINTIIPIKDDDELLLKIKEWKTNRNIPDRVVLSEGDNELYIDMNNPLSIRAWLSVVKKCQYFTLVEFLFDQETAIVHGPEGAFANEFVFAFYKKLSAKN